MSAAEVLPELGLGIDDEPGGAQLAAVLAEDREDRAARLQLAADRILVVARLEREDRAARLEREADRIIAVAPAPTAKAAPVPEVGRGTYRTGPITLPGGVQARVVAPPRPADEVEAFIRETPSLGELFRDLDQRVPARGTRAVTARRGAE